MKKSKINKGSGFRQFTFKRLVGKGVHGILPVWVRLCALRWELFVYTLSQPSVSHLCTFRFLERSLKPIAVILPFGSSHRPNMLPLPLKTILLNAFLRLSLFEGAWKLECESVWFMLLVEAAEDIIFHGDIELELAEVWGILLYDDETFDGAEGNIVSLELQSLELNDEDPRSVECL